MQQDYIRTARAKGLADRVVIVRHMLRNALIPVVTIMGPALAALVTGSFIIETMFAFPGDGPAVCEVDQQAGLFDDHGHDLDLRGPDRARELDRGPRLRVPGSAYPAGRLKDMTTPLQTGQPSEEAVRETLQTISRPSRSLWSDALHRLLRNKGSVLGALVVVFFLLVAILRLSSPRMIPCRSTTARATCPRPSSRPPGTRRPGFSARHRLYGPRRVEPHDLRRTCVHGGRVWCPS